MAYRQQRTIHRKWDPDTCVYPEKGINMQTVYERASRRRDKPMAFQGFADESHGSPDYPHISIYWIEHWGNNPVYGDDSFNRIKGTEAICRAEAARLGFDVVVLRAGLHNKRNQHDEYGTIRTKNDPRSGRQVNDTVDADWHLTVLMGYDTENLVIHGHIYVAWDSKVSCGIRVVKDATERKHVRPGEEPGPSAYWSLC
ncbi:hypothetical protein QR685DRAFT_542544 [Neurospora intermedia]|uniref:Peptidase C39-like domain-containing protein n=1 Tax=Neurospora intermedia TaxID=5142 RepID=A0ABR3DN27_NEUIN